MAARGRGLLKKSCQKPLDIVQCNLAGMLLWWPSIEIVQPSLLVKKTWPPGGGAYFPYILYKQL